MPTFKHIVSALVQTMFQEVSASTGKPYWIKSKVTIPAALYMMSVVMSVSYMKAKSASSIEPHSLHFQPNAVSVLVSCM